MQNSTPHTATEDIVKATNVKPFQAFLGQYDESSLEVQAAEFLMHIRKATLADIPALMAMEKNAATAAHWKIAHYETLFAEQAGRAVLLLENENGIHGFIAGQTDGREWEIENVVVAESLQQQGWGAKL